MVFEVVASWLGHTVKFDLTESDDGRTVVEKATDGFQNALTIAQTVFAQNETAHIRVQMEEKAV